MITTPFTYVIVHDSGLWYYGVKFKEGCHPKDLWDTYFTSSESVKTLIEIHGENSFKAYIRKIFTTVSDAIDWEHRVVSKILGTPNCLNECAWPAVSKEASKKSHLTRSKIGDDGLTTYQRASLKWKNKKDLINPKSGLTYNQEKTNKRNKTKLRPENIEKAKIRNAATSKRLILNNPSKNPETLEKIKIALKTGYSTGKYATTKGLKFPSISEKLKGRQFTLNKKWYNDGINNFRYEDGRPEIQNLLKGMLPQKSPIRTKIICPHCNLEGSTSNLKRYHFDNCKIKLENNIML